MWHHKHRRNAFIAAAVVLVAGIAAWRGTVGTELPLVSEAEAASTAPVTLPFTYQFTTAGTLVETGSLEESSSPYWWLNSGAYLNLANGVGSTLQGELPSKNRWRRLYARNNPVDTDNGYHPQNVFRLFLRTTWKDVSQEAFFRINKYNLSASPNRNQTNGLHLMNRITLDGDDAYYAGVRVDGQAAIKKKKNGVYYTMAVKQFIPGTYDLVSNPNLLPTGKWIGVKSEVKNIDANSVSVKLYADVGRTGTWTLVAEAVDDGVKYGGAVLPENHEGLRTDFMDADFDDYALKAL